MSEKSIKTNGLKAWILASRPKTLTGAAAPVIIGSAIAWNDIFTNKITDIYQTESVSRFFIPVVLCFLFAFVMQIDANFINDYFDYKKGSDREDRLGPERACAQGWVTPNAMKKAIVITTVLACIIGLPLIYFGGWGLIIIGILCVIFCFLYTTKLSYLGFGDLLVLVFFGIIPVGFTYYIATGEWTSQTTLSGIACGLATDCLLMVNNYRDRHQDALSGKQTIVVKLGEKFGLESYLWLGIIAMLLAFATLFMIENHYAVLLLLYGVLHIQTYRKMRKTDGKALNSVLGKTARNIFIFGLIYAIAVLAYYFSINTTA